MAKYLASQGVGSPRAQGSARKLQYPFLVIIGPSGQFGQIMAPSGTWPNNINYDLPEDPFAMSAWGNVFNHKSLAFYKNEILYSLRVHGTLNTDCNYAYQLYGQTEGIKINPQNGALKLDANTSLSRQVAFDGFFHKQFYATIKGHWYELAGYLRLPGDKILFATQNFKESLMYGLYDGSNPIWIELAAGEGSYPILTPSSGWMPYCQIYGQPGTTSDVAWSPGLAGSVNNWIGGLDCKDSTEAPTNMMSCICDMVNHKGTIYIAQQSKVIGLTLDGKCNFIHNDYVDDSNVDQVDIGTELYQSRTNNGTITPGSRCFAEYKGILYMLQNNGKLYTVSPGGLKEVANLTTLGTPYSSGIFGGQANTTIGSVTSRRCFLSNFNSQLHAFLNYSTTYKVAKGTEGATGRGLFWATSYDGVNWTDRTVNIPGSGTCPPSGLTSAQYNNITYPYKFAGRVGVNKKYTIWQILASGTQTPGPLKYTTCHVSGIMQHTEIPMIWGSGDMLDPPGTAFNSLNMSMKKGIVSGYLAPTWVTYPQGFKTVTVSGVKKFHPYGHSASGYDYTGCHNWHISGFTDEDKDVLHLVLSENYHGISAYGQVLYYQLNKTSGWDRKNYLPKCNQLNGLIPIDMYDPEVIIPSGSFYNSNPKVDEVNHTISVDFKIFDWPFWSNVNIKMEYSIDGYTWHSACGLRNISTGSKASDPSGIIGTQHTIIWNYGNDLSPNMDYNYLQLRIRATEV